MAGFGTVVAVIRRRMIHHPATRCGDDAMQILQNWVSLGAVTLHEYDVKVNSILEKEIE
jgi:hypothetical protein